MAQRTPLFAWHEAHGGRMVEFAGWSLPVNYGPGIIAEHLACRKFGALFDISHMGRFLIKGPAGSALLSRTLTNDVSRLRPGFSQYTLFSDGQGHPLDDAYLYQFKPGENLLVVNAANRPGDWDLLNRQARGGEELQDVTNMLAMVAVQGPGSEALLTAAGVEGLPPKGRGHTAVARWGQVELLAARTGYTGEPLGFEIMVPAAETAGFWEALIRAGAPLGILPAGLGARDTLRLEAGLPLYGHELHPERPILSLPRARHGVSLDPDRGDFRGREALTAQEAALRSGDFHRVPRMIMKVAALEKGMIREGSPVRFQGRRLGELTSGTMVPAWKFKGSTPGDETFTRALGLAYLDRDRSPGDRVTVEYRGREIQGEIVQRFMKPEGDYLRALPAGID
ncbi:MAG: glycine cleavage system aminomethyltransferase GcvT [Deltaproteobacteria bacterium]|nr:glycine cleavage system aminomethyltransferase GcvT [Deltaproteobacteria bacterium]